MSVALLANPASGKDVRRVDARASVFDNQEKAAMLRRCLAGIRATADVRVHYLPDRHGIAASALAEFDVDAVPVDCPITASAADTERAAACFARSGARAVVVLGGDGTNRAFAKGWLDAPLLPLSTGTNNAFPKLQEATTAGAAAGLVASGQVPLEQAAVQSKAIHVAIEDESDDLALIDAVLTSDRFIGARALSDPDRLLAAMLTRADPAGVGMVSVGGFAQPLSPQADAALTLWFDAAAEQTVHAALAPGRFATVGIATLRTLALGEPMTLVGPGVLAFDGERERVLKAGQRATLRALRNGPRVIDAARVLHRAVRCGRPLPNARADCGH